MHPPHPPLDSPLDDFKESKNVKQSSMLIISQKNFLQEAPIISITVNIQGGYNKTTFSFPMA